MKPPIQLRSGAFNGASLATVGRQKGILVAAARLEGKRLNVWLSDLFHNATEKAREEIEKAREEGC